MKNFLIYLCFMFLAFYPVINYAEGEYRAMDISIGKVIVGLDKESALEKFGIPAQAAEDIWSYTGAKKFFVFFSGKSALNIHLYPKRCNASIGNPIEFKVFSYLPGQNIKDITSEAELLISEPKSFTLDKAGIVIPKKAGEYQILAKYKEIFSSPAYISVKESQSSGEETLISINILPYKPVIPYRGELQFLALGTFRDSGAYSIKDISKQVTWHIKHGQDITSSRTNIILFPFSEESYQVFCTYKNLRSYVQEVTTLNKTVAVDDKLKHIMLLPESAKGVSGDNIYLRAFGTYNSNRVNDITSDVRWEISDKDVLILSGGGDGFLARSPGIAEVTAVLGWSDLKSIASKVIISGKPGKTKNTDIAPEEKKEFKPEDTSPGKINDDIKKEVVRLKQELIKEEKVLKLIKISPDTLVLSVGESKQLAASGIYSDKSQADLTYIADWSSSNDKIVMVSRGKIDAVSPEEARITVKFKGVTSSPAQVKVEGPKLVSIILAPQNLKFSMGEYSSLKAEGCFSDSSRKDITSLVNWKVANPRILKINKGRITPLKIGETAVYAEYSGIQSLPAEIRIIFTIAWLIHLILKVLLLLFLYILAVFVVSYVLTQKIKNHLMSCLDSNPREFIVNLYENTKKILAIFYSSFKEPITPLSYAELVQKNYTIENNFFAGFTAKFEEARYSSHILTKDDAVLFLRDYNKFLKMIFGRYSKTSVFIKYARSILHRTPLFISYR